MSEVTASSDYQFNFRNQVFSQLETQARRMIYFRRPDLWARDVLGVTLWSKQVEIAMSIVDNKSTMVAASHSVGKSYLTAVICCWWIDVHPIGEARVISTAPTNAQVKGIIWRDIQKLHKVSRDRHREYLTAVEKGRSTQGLPDHALPGYVTSQATWRSFDGIELGSGRTPPRGREGDAFQGIHGGVLAVADEAVGVSKEMIGTLGNNTTADDDRMLMIANPTNPRSYMGELWHDPKVADKYHKISISAFDSPKFTDEGASLPDDVLKYLVGQKYVDDMAAEHGTESAYYISRVLGRWATESGMLMFPDEVLAVGKESVVIPDPDGIVRFGFDVARSEKGDYSYVYMAEEGWVYQTHEWREGPEGVDLYPLDEPRNTGKRGIKIRYLDSWRGLPFQPLHDPAGKLISEGANERVDALARQYGATEIRIDAAGMGRNMIDAMIELSYDKYDLIPFNGGDASPDRLAWYNQRAYQFSELARRMRLGEVDIDPGDSKLIEQLAAMEYTFAAGYAESMLIESKESMRRRGIKSPDAADAASYAFANIDLTNRPEPGTNLSYELDHFITESNGFYDYSW